MDETIQSLQRAAIAFRDARDWAQFHTLKDLALGLQIEAAELAELLLWKSERESEELLSNPNFRSRLAAELADIQIFLLYLAERSGLDLARSVRDKLRENEAKYPREIARGSAAKYTELATQEAPSTKSSRRRSLRDDKQAFERVIAVDWSGKRRGARESIWLCEVAAGRVLRLEAGRSREEVAKHLVGEAEKDPRFVVGFDFAFSFPAWFVRERAGGTIEGAWKEAEQRGEKWLAACPTPFWGKPGTRKPPSEVPTHRATELAVAKEYRLYPMPVFQIGGAGTVGFGSVRGMPLLRRLRDAGFSIWPFDPPSPPLVVEMWPRLLTGDVRKMQFSKRRRYLNDRYPELADGPRAAGEANDDAFDALVSALEMDKYREEFGRLAQVGDPNVRLEGEIWRPGV